MRQYVYLILFTVSRQFENVTEVQGIVFVCMFLKCFFCHGVQINTQELMLTIQAVSSNRPL